MAEVWVLGASAFFACENRKKNKNVIKLGCLIFCNGKTVFGRMKS